MHGWQEQWDSFNQRSAEPQRQSEVLQARIQQLETSMERVAERQRRLAEERALLAADPEDAAILELSELLATSELTHGELQGTEEQLVERLEQVRHDLQQATHNQQQALHAVILARSSWQACSQRRQLSAHTAQCCMFMSRACISHSLPHAWHATRQA